MYQKVTNFSKPNQRDISQPNPWVLQEIDHQHQVLETNQTFETLIIKNGEKNGFLFSTESINFRQNK